MAAASAILNPSLGLNRHVSIRCARPTLCRASGHPESEPSTSSNVPSSHHRRQALATILSTPLLLNLTFQIPHALATTSNTALRPLSSAERQAIETAFSATMSQAKAPVMLRLVFHDAGTYSKPAGDGGPNASVRFELERPENFGLKRGWRVIEATAEKLQGTAAEGAVSFADLIALAGARSVSITGGPDIDVLVGRVDATGPDPENRLPMETFTAPEQLAAFATMGLSAEEFIALCGSHTLGSKGYGDPLTFDNVYYTALLKKPWENKKDAMAAMIGIPSDHVLPDDPTCRPIIEKYAADQAAFHKDFAAAFLKLTSLGI